MLRHRIIPVLLLSKSGFVKTYKFTSPNYVGDPINIVRIFNEKEADEIIVLDIDASSKKLQPNYQMIERIAGECFMPLAYGGGVDSVDQAKRIFESGVEKICLQTAALKRPNLVEQIANIFGSQSVVVSIDLKRNWFGRLKVYNKNIASNRLDDWSSVIKTMENAGAGEIIVNSVDRDGTRSGPDLEMIRCARSVINVPLVALGGVSSIQDIKEAIANGANAVAAGSFFVYHGPHRAVLITYPNIKDIEVVPNRKDHK